MENVIETIGTWIGFYGLKFLYALIIFIVGRWAARLVKQGTKKMMTKKNVEPTIITFSGDLAYFALMAFVIVAALNKMGVQTTSFVAVVGAAGLAIGLAFKDSLSNFSSGFLMILLKPFAVGDYIEGAGTAGTVEKIRIFNTQLRTPDNKTIIIPNAKLTADNIVNYSVKGTRRVDLVFGIGYGDDIDKAKKILSEIIAEDQRILRDPEPKVAVVELGDSSVNFVFRPWVNSQDYWDVVFDTNEKVKKRFDQEGISIPFPQRDVHIYEQKAA